MATAKKTPTPKPTSKPAVKKPVQPGAKKPVAALLKEPAAKKAPAAKGSSKLPKSMAECADMLYTIRQDRYAQNKVVEELKAKEALLVEHLIQNLPKSAATGIAGKVARATVASKTIPQAQDWDKIQAYILANGKKNPGVFSLLQRRLGEATVKEMWDAGKSIPGVEPFEVKTISLNKL